MTATVLVEARLRSRYLPRNVRGRSPGRLRSGWTNAELKLRHVVHVHQISSTLSLGRARSQSRVWGVIDGALLLGTLTIGRVVASDS